MSFIDEENNCFSLVPVSDYADLDQCSWVVFMRIRFEAVKLSTILPDPQRVNTARMLYVKSV